MALVSIPVLMSHLIQQLPQLARLLFTVGALFAEVKCHVKISQYKQRKVGSEKYAFKDLTDGSTEPLCSICHETVAVMKHMTIKYHCYT